MEITKQNCIIDGLKTNKTNEINTRAPPIEIIMPLFFGEKEEEHLKKFLKVINAFLAHRRIAPQERMITFENSLRGKALKWYSMIKDATPNEDTFKELFLKQFFSESKQWNTFTKCT